MAGVLHKTFGIDLGTTYSCISYVDEFGKPVTVKNAENDRITPSVVFFDGGSVIVGKVAKETPGCIQTPSSRWSSGAWATRSTSSNTTARAIGRR